MNRRRYPVLVSLLSAVLLVGLAGCGGGSTTSGPKLYKPTPGGVVPLTPQNEFLSLPRSVVQEKNGDYLVDDSGNYDRTGAKVELFSLRASRCGYMPAALTFRTPPIRSRTATSSSPIPAMTESSR